MQARCHLHLLLFVIGDLTFKLLNINVALLDRFSELIDLEAGLFGVLPLLHILFDDLFSVVQLVLDALNVQFKLLLDFDVVSDFGLVFLKLAFVN